jgi:hypothetical protein
MANPVGNKLQTVPRQSARNRMQSRQLAGRLCLLERQSQTPDQIDSVRPLSRGAGGDHCRTDPRRSAQVATADLAGEEGRVGRDAGKAHHGLGRDFALK